MKGKCPFILYFQLELLWYTVTVIFNLWMQKDLFAEMPRFRKNFRKSLVERKRSHLCSLHFILAHPVKAPLSPRGGRDSGWTKGSQGSNLGRTSWYMAGSRICKKRRPSVEIGGKLADIAPIGWICMIKLSKRKGTGRIGPYLDPPLPW